MKSDKSSPWYEVRLSKKQLSFLDLLCRFHLSESTNEFAKVETRKLQWCLAHSQKPKARQ